MYKVMSLMASGLKVEKKPKAWEGLYTGIPSSRMSVWSGPPQPRYVNGRRMNGCSARHRFFLCVPAAELMAAQRQNAKKKAAPAARKRKPKAKPKAKPAATGKRRRSKRGDVAGRAAKEKEFERIEEIKAMLKEEEKKLERSKKR